MSDTGHIKRKFEVFRRIAFLGFCRRSETAKQVRSSVDGKSTMPLAIGFLCQNCLALCGFAWGGGGGGAGGGGKRQEGMVGGGRST